MKTYLDIDDERISHRLTLMGELWPLFRTPNIVWHTTTPSRFQKIFKEGIRPSDGSIISDYPESLGSYLKSICIFDFSTPSEKDALLAENSWGSFLVDTAEPGKIFMAIDKSKLDQDCLIHQKHPKYLRMAEIGDENRFRNQIATVECWYEKKIETSFIQQVVLIKKFPHPYQFKVFEFDDQVPSGVDKVMQDWRMLEQIQKNEDLKAGKINWPELLMASWSKI